MLAAKIRGVAKREARMCNYQKEEEHSLFNCQVNILNEIHHDTPVSQCGGSGERPMDGRGV